MAYLKTRSKRKISGGRFFNYTPRRKSQLGSNPSLTKIGETKLKIVRIMGGNKKKLLLRAEFCNLAKKDGTFSKIKINSVVENPANRHFVRRNIITKGSIISTEQGNAVVTSRPGQVGVINAKLV
ncbi:30S ribosomal protein S8e [Candidatus Woesearchaeota archaeon]|jgi:small subunit ribosomal protein S8e|nr:30S ribosomal protein S8e [Candidatus Woesearchaeota archaeon]MBT4387777.1 30S ribosomal protein S8e [Candidatus Woesearchaeota archaeon]MBT4595596.1 30S ribosomal protein S8e [Candidatus Woesearchaeota archaeon]MBT5740921.1 30S ribosomal protein S8e [Candidatus Woesearchaeota archaeon]MBT6505293.1 30S ribosomal protein S8e [Candidatus Woesearchaeota archaeon]